MEMKGTQWVVKDKEREDYYWPSEALKKRAWVSEKGIYEEAAKDPLAWWDKLAKEGISWFREWTDIYKEDSEGNISWFIGGKLNLSYNIADRYKESRREKIAIYWEPEDLKKSKRQAISYGELDILINKLGNALRKLGVKKGDTVAIYLPMIPEALISMIACTRIGAVHAVVFSAFSKMSLNERLCDANAKILITADGYFRRGKQIGLKANAEAGMEGTTQHFSYSNIRSNFKCQGSIKVGKV